MTKAEFFMMQIQFPQRIKIGFFFEAEGRKFAAYTKSSALSREIRINFQIIFIISMLFEFKFHRKMEAIKMQFW